MPAEEPATPVVAIIFGPVVFASLVALRHGGDLLAVIGTDFLVLAALTVAPLTVTEGMIGRFEAYWLSSGMPRRQRWFGYLGRTIFRVVTVWTVYFAVPGLLLTKGIYLLTNWYPIIFVGAWQFAYAAVIGLPITAVDLLMRVLWGRQSRPTEAKPVTLRTALEQWQGSPWLPVLAFGFLVVGAVLQILATAY